MVLETGLYLNKTINCRVRRVQVIYFTNQYNVPQLRKDQQAAEYCFQDKTSFEPMPDLSRIAGNPNAPAERTTRLDARGPGYQ